MLFVMNGRKRIEKRPMANEVHDPRRTLVLLLAAALLAGSAAAWWFGEKGAATFAAAAMGRIGLVMGALWLAWPSLRRPARWLPPGVAVLGVVALGVLAASPRLVVVVVPALSVLIALAAVVRGFRVNR
tara:strand:- start:642038 stop:642424 length:387 start_codon:yes stop_codon:yes gene_type:complete